ncbi:40s ribosomal protein sa-like [Lynx pardinus]|uniref:40s ribosomal protein sa-like n=1 Tax=Lynx pardinus TaxID=191816 RepID=A0A485NIH7_LYNPA|nr:40s ribosomal protein sa-like [Lynx pardinus]
MKDVLKFFAAGTHLGDTNLDFQMEQCIYKWKSDGIYVINLKRTWEKLLMVACAIIAIENPADTLLCVIWTLPSLATTRVCLMWWVLAWEVLHICGTVSCECPWEVMPVLYFYRDPEEVEKDEQAATEKAVTKEDFQAERTVPAPEFTVTHPEVADWSKGMEVHAGPIQQFPTEG